VTALRADSARLDYFDRRAKVCLTHVLNMRRPLSSSEQTSACFFCSPASPRMAAKPTSDRCVAYRRRLRRLRWVVPRLPPPPPTSPVRAPLPTCTSVRLRRVPTLPPSLFYAGVACAVSRRRRPPSPRSPSRASPASARGSAERPRQNGVIRGPQAIACPLLDGVLCIPWRMALESFLVPARHTTPHANTHKACGRN